MLCGAAIGFFALGAAAAYRPQAAVYLPGGILPVVRNILGMTGIGLIFCLVAGSLIAWVGPLAFSAISQSALIANYSEPLTWPTRSPTDRGGWIAAMVVFAFGLAAFTIRGPRVRPSGELERLGGRIRVVVLPRRRAGLRRIEEVFLHRWFDGERIFSIDLVNILDSLWAPREWNRGYPDAVPNGTC